MSDRVQSSLLRMNNFRCKIYNPVAMIQVVDVLAVFSFSLFLSLSLSMKLSDRLKDNSRSTDWPFVSNYGPFESGRAELKYIKLIDY